jgi:hypothetical protein
MSAQNNSKDGRGVSKYREMVDMRCLLLCHFVSSEASSNKLATYERSEIRYQARGIRIICRTVRAFEARFQAGGSAPGIILRTMSSAPANTTLTIKKRGRRSA